MKDSNLFMAHMDELGANTDDQRRVVDAYKDLRQDLARRGALIPDLVNKLRKTIDTIGDIVGYSAPDDANQDLYDTEVAAAHRCVPEATAGVLEHLKQGTLRDLIQDPSGFESDESESMSEESGVREAARSRRKIAIQQLEVAQRRLNNAIKPSMREQQTRTYESMKDAGLDVPEFDAFRIWCLGLETERLRKAEKEYSAAATEARRLGAMPLEDLESRFSDNTSAVPTSNTEDSGLSKRVSGWQADEFHSPNSDGVAWSEPALSMTRPISSDQGSPGKDASPSVGHSTQWAWLRDHRHREKWNEIRQQQMTELLDNWPQNFPGLEKPPIARKDRLIAGEKRKLPRQKARAQSSGGVRKASKTPRPRRSWWCTIL